MAKSPIKTLIKRRRLLIDALRSGKYKKGTGALVTTRGDTKSYCVFGVAREVWKKQRDKTSMLSYTTPDQVVDMETVAFEDIKNSQVSVPFELRLYFGFNDRYGKVTADDVIYWNDFSKKSFNYIADRLEKDLNRIIAEHKVG